VGEFYKKFAYQYYTEIEIKNQGKNSPKIGGVIVKSVQNNGVCGREVTGIRFF